MTPIKLTLQGDNYTRMPYWTGGHYDKHLDYYGCNLDKAEIIRLDLKAMGIFAITRYYNGLYHVYIRETKGDLNDKQ